MKEKLTIDNKKLYNIDYIIKNNMLGYKYLRGSWSHGIGVEGKSDYDYGGVFFAPKEMILGLRSNYVEQVSDEKNDETYYEFGRWIELLLKSNPTALESLFIDKKFVIGDAHPAIQHIIDNKEKFLCKEAFNPLIGYSIAQIRRATGYNKKCNIPEDFQRRDILDFCYTFKNQGSQPIKEFLSENNLDQKYCGLVNIPNMRDTYGMYYDFAAYFKFEIYDKDKEFWKENFNEENFQNWCFDMRFRTLYSDKFMNYDYCIETYNRIVNHEFFAYAGIVNPDELTKSNEVRLSSIPKGEKPICFMHYNKDAYTCHCKDYKEWDEWKKNRNQIRFSDNKGYNFDAKNMCETVRLIHTGIELARDGVFNVERTWDRDFLLNIKNHNVSYEEISKYIKGKKEEFDELITKSNLPDTIDYNEINNLLIESRKKLYKF